MRRLVRIDLVSLRIAHTPLVYLGSDATTSQILCSLRLSAFGKGQEPRKKYIVINPTLGVPKAPDGDAESMVGGEHRMEYLIKIFEVALPAELLDGRNSRNGTYEWPEQHGDLSCETDVVHLRYRLYLDKHIRVDLNNLNGDRQPALAQFKCVAIGF